MEHYVVVVMKLGVLSMAYSFEQGGRAQTPATIICRKTNRYPLGKFRRLHQCSILRSYLIEATVDLGQWSVDSKAEVFGWRWRRFLSCMEHALHAFGSSRSFSVHFALHLHLRMVHDVRLGFLWESPSPLGPCCVCGPIHRSMDGHRRT